MNASLLVLNRDDYENESLRALTADWEDVEVWFFKELEAAEAWLRLAEQPVSAVLLGSTEIQVWERLRRLEASRNSVFYALGVPPPATTMNLGKVADNVVVQPFAAAQFEERVAPLIAATGARKLSALLVDETCEARDAICRTLGNLGFLTVFQADDSLAAIELLKNRKQMISLVVTSCESPFQSFREVHQTLRTDPKIYTIPMVLLTSRRSLEEWITQDQLGVTFEGRWLGWPSKENYRPLQERLHKELHQQRQIDSFLREAEVFRRRGVPGYGVEILRHALRRFPAAFSLHEGLAELYLADFSNTDYLKNAAEVLEKGLTVAPRSREAALKIAGIWGRLEKWNDTIRVLQKWLKEAPFDDAARTLLAQVYIKQGDRTAALIQLRRVLILNRSNQEAIRLKATLDAPSYSSESNLTECVATE